MARASVKYGGFLATLRRGKNYTAREIENKVIKPSLLLALKEFYKARYMRRFGPENSSYTTKRNKKYEAGKFRKYGHKLRMVYTGETSSDSLLRQMRQTVTFRVSKPGDTGMIRGRMTFPGARKINRFKETVRKRLHLELRIMLQRDLDFIKKSFLRNTRIFVRDLKHGKPLRKVL